MGEIVSFQQLDAWREAHALVLKVYQVTQAFPHTPYFLLPTPRRSHARPPLPGP